MERFIRKLIKRLTVYLDEIISLTTREKQKQKKKKRKREQKSKRRRNENNLHGMMRTQIAKQRNGSTELIYTKGLAKLLHEVLS